LACLELTFLIKGTYTLNDRFTSFESARIVTAQIASKVINATRCMCLSSAHGMTAATDHVTHHSHLIWPYNDVSEPSADVFKHIADVFKRSADAAAGS
jgi:hypothetical protein